MNNLKVLEIMASKNISKYKLSKLSNVSEAQIGKILKGKHTNPHISTVKAIAKVLNVDINEII